MAKSLRREPPRRKNDRRAACRTGLSDHIAAKAVGPVHRRHRNDIMNASPLLYGLRLEKKLQKRGVSMSSGIW